MNSLICLPLPSGMNYIGLSAGFGYASFVSAGTSQRHSEPQRQIPTGLTYSCELGLHTFSFSSKCTVEKQCNLLVRVQAQEPKCVNLGDHF